MRADVEENYNEDTEKYKNYRASRQSIKSFKKDGGKDMKE